MTLRIRTLLSATLTLTLSTAAAAQTTFYVDDNGLGDPAAGNPFISDPLEDGSSLHPFDRIQEAIDAAADNDEVLVLAGLYFDFATIDVSSGQGSGKSLWIHSSDGAAATTIDAAGILDQVMQAVSGEDANTIIEGLTLKNGSSAVIGNDRGAGLNIGGSSPTVIDCVFDSNTATFGGGVYSNSGAPTLRRCVFRNNLAQNGGGMYINTGGSIEACTFENNTTTSDGAGLFVNASMTIRDTVFVGNQSTGNGGAVYQHTSSPLVQFDRCQFVGNTTGGWGGGIHATQTMIVRNCVFNANNANGAGGGLGLTSSSSTVVEGCTFVNQTGYGIRVSTGSATVRNSILWGNGPAEYLGVVIFSHSDVLGGAAGPGMIDADPRFVDAWGPDNIQGTLDDDLRLGGKSPAIDAGNASIPAGYEEYPVDIRGEARVIDWEKVADTGIAVVGQSTDMGAYERQPKPCPKTSTRMPKP
jgi:predicted outer membrane repeat protein